MIPFIIFLIILSFLETAALPLNFVLLILVSRAFIVEGRSNYYLAFSFGIFLSLLSGNQIGFLSIIYLTAVYILSAIRRTHFSAHWSIIFPLGASILSLDRLSRTIFLGESPSVSVFIIQLLLILPIYFIIRFWEERFIPRKEIKLKM